MIDINKYYPPTAPELRPVGAVQTLARWRHERCGPPYIKSGSRVLYLGKDVVDWLTRHRVEPTAEPRPRSLGAADRDGRADR